MPRRLKYCKLFKFLVSRQVPPPIIRLLINFCTGNFLCVAWCGIVFEYFLAINGVKQVGMLSPVLFCLYMDGLLVAFSKAGVGWFIGRIWGLPFNSQCYLLPLLSQCLPLLDEICRRSLNFIESCIYNGSSLARAVANYGIQYGRYNSFLGHNLLFCTKLCNCSARDIISGSVNRIVDNYTSKLFKDYQLQTASFVSEIVLIREGT